MLLWQTRFSYCSLQRFGVAIYFEWGTQCLWCHSTGMIGHLMQYKIYLLTIVSFKIMWDVQWNQAEKCIKCFFNCSLAIDVGLPYALGKTRINKYVDLKKTIYFFFCRFTLFAFNSRELKNPHLTIPETIPFCAVRDEICELVAAKSSRIPWGWNKN
jgi:hypothetical protein